MICSILPIIVFSWPTNSFQVVNYPEADVNWTRISEYKHSPNQPAGVREYPGTVVYREYSTDEGDPYYPVPNKRNKELYLKYQVIKSSLFISK